MRLRGGWAPCARTILGSTPATSRSFASRAGLRSGAARCPRGRGSSSRRGGAAEGVGGAGGRGPLPAASDLELLSGGLEEELRRLGEQDVQSLLLESGPTLAAAFLAADLVDKLMLFVAPTISGEGPGLFAAPPAVLTHQTARGIEI